MNTRSITIATCLATLLCAQAFAEEPGKTIYVPDKVESKKEKLKHTGWDGSFNIGASTALSQSSSVVGRIDGTSFTFGAQLKGGLLYLKNAHEWRNALGYGLTYTRTPALPAFIKTNDELGLESIYLYHLKRVPWLGPFARVTLNLPFFPGDDVRSRADAVGSAPAGQTLYVNKADPTDRISLGNSRLSLGDDDVASLRLSDPFLPTRLRETVGVFAKPVDRSDLGLEVKLGFDARQTFAGGQLAIDDDSTTADIEFSRLSDVYQGGPSAGIVAAGVMADKRVGYVALAEVMIPVINNQSSGDDKSIGELTNVHLELNLSFKLVAWASLDYQFKALYEPQLLDEFQLQNNLLLTFSYALIRSNNS